jgi:tetratricopeptide (TPR) repeat protein
MLRFCSASLFVLANIVCGAQSTPQEFIDKAYELSSTGEVEQAIALYDSAISKFPEEPILYTIKAGLMARDIRNLATDDSLYNLSLQLLDKAIQIDSTFTPAYNNRALLNLYFQHFEDAVHDFTQVIRFSKDDEAIYSAMQDRATAKGYNKDYRGSMTDYKFLIKVKPKDTELYLNQGVIYQHLGRLDSAQISYRKGLALNPQHQGLLNNMGMLMIRQQNYAEAISYFKQAIELDPSEPFAYNNTGFALIKLNKADEALRYINQSIELYPQNSYAYKNRAIALIALGKVNDACADLTMASILGYSKSYDDEVDRLKATHCSK